MLDHTALLVWPYRSRVSLGMYGQFFYHLTYINVSQMFLSSAISFILYSIILLRLRGSIYTVEGHWRIRWISTEESWRLKLTQDNVDTQIVKVVRILLWFPVSCSFHVILMF